MPLRGRWEGGVSVLEKSPRCEGRKGRRAANGFSASSQPPSRDSGLRRISPFPLPLPAHELESFGELKRVHSAGEGSTRLRAVLLARGSKPIVTPNGATKQVSHTCPTSARKRLLSHFKHSPARPQERPHRPSTWLPSTRPLRQSCSSSSPPRPPSPSQSPRQQP